MERDRCNAAEGYQYFRRLRQLRLDRRDRQQELASVQLFAERFDCEAMRETCEEIVGAMEE